MKKSVFLFIGILFLSVAVFAQKSEVRNVEKFRNLSLSINADVEITIGNKQSVKIEADEKSLKNIETVVQGNTLRIKKERQYKRIGKNVKVYVTVENLQDVDLAGSGTLEVKNKWKVDETELSLAGSGDIIINDIEADEIEADIAGSGDVKVYGVVNDFEASIAGSGSVKAKELKAQYASIDIAGSGSVYIEAIKKLRVSIAGSGDVYYKGSPKTDISSAGSGRVNSL